MDSVPDKWHTARDYIIGEMEKMTGINLVIEGNKIGDTEIKDMVGYVHLIPSQLPITVQSGFRSIQLAVELGIFIKNENKSADGVKLDDAQCLLYQLMTSLPGNVQGKYKSLKPTGMITQAPDRSYVQASLTL